MIFPSVDLVFFDKCESGSPRSALARRQACHAGEFLHAFVFAAIDGIYTILTFFYHHLKKVQTMSQKFKAVMFRVEADEPEWIDLGEFEVNKTLGCLMLEHFAISSSLGFFFDEEGRLAGKKINKCVAKYAPCENYTDFCGDVLLLAHDDGGDMISVTESDLSSLKELLGADLKKRKEFYGTLGGGVIF